MEKSASQTILEVFAVFLVGIVFVLGQMIWDEVISSKRSEERVLGAETEFLYQILDRPKEIDIVDTTNDNLSVEFPAVSFTSGEFSLDPQNTQGILGTDVESVRAFNYTDDDFFDVALAPVIDVLETFADVEWSNEQLDPLDRNAFPMNHMVPEAGRLSADFDSATISSDVSACQDSVTDVAKGSNAFFRYNDASPPNPGEESIESIDIMMGSGDVKYCRYDIRGIEMNQIVPGGQAVDSYILDMILTIT